MKNKFVFLTFFTLAFCGIICSFTIEMEASNAQFLRALSLIGFLLAARSQSKDEIMNSDSN